MGIIKFSVLVHAVFVVVGTLRDHRRRRNVGDLDVVLISDEGLGVVPEGVSHELGDTAQLLALDEAQAKTVTYPHTTTSSSILPQRRATVALTLESYAPADSCSKRL